MEDYRGEINNYKDFNIHQYWIPVKNNSCEMNVINPKWDKIKGGVQDLIIVFRLPFQELTAQQVDQQMEDFRKLHSDEKYSKFNVHSYYFADNGINEPIISIINPNY
jgi:hypothetical protein